MKYNKKYVSLIILFYLLIYEIPFSSIQISGNYFNPKTIFTFWEPRENIPGYIKLCIRTWKKYLFDYEIKILDYKTAKEYLGESLFSSIICKNMSLAVQADAIRVALLNKYGGLWIDTDTIILNGNFMKEVLLHELTMVRDSKTGHHYIGFIYASNNSNLMKNWLKKIQYKVKVYKYLLDRKDNNFWETTGKKLKNVIYLGNQILNPLLKNVKRYKMFHLDSDEINAFPERKFCYNYSLAFYINRYKSFYFTRGDPQTILKNTRSLILLHNSWTPPKYKNMSESEFLKQDILLSKLLSKLLEKKI